MSIKKKVNRLIQKTSWNIILSIFKTYNRMPAYFHYPIIGPILKRLANLETDGHTQGYTLNLNVDLADKVKGVVLPIDMMKQAIGDSECRVIMKQCLCRTTYACKDFPHNHGCIFLGEKARAFVKNGTGREASVEEAIAHIDKGADLGLVGQALWIEFERFLLGLKREKNVAHWLEICFCCPCCCGAFKSNRITNLQEMKDRFRSIGWKAVLNDELCVKCQQCIKKCPIEAISFENNQVAINQQKCLGCGLCAAQCQKKAIKLQLKTPLLETLKDYFSSSGLKVDM